MSEFVCIGEVSLRDKTGEYSEAVAVYVRREDLKRITVGDLVETFARILANVRETNPSTADAVPLPFQGRQGKNGEATKEGGGRAWDT